MAPRTIIRGRYRAVCDVSFPMSPVSYHAGEEFEISDYPSLHRPTVYDLMTASDGSPLFEFIGEEIIEVPPGARWQI